jgi:GATA-binding protein, other eukaryote
MTGGIPIMHTDDAASKETQYLRRRCFNCHTTEPPSWRRSTLNPGKIVCNKCGLYERTHLRPRPHRFDELRATSKARKAATKAGTGPQQVQSSQQPIQQHHIMQQQSQAQVPQHTSSPNLSPKSQHAGYVKKEPVDEYDIRRASAGSVGSSNLNGAQEWDQNIPRLSHSPPSSHAASPIRLPSLPGASVGSRTPEAQRPYFERRTSMPTALESGAPGQRPHNDETHQPAQWQQGTISVAELIDDDKPGSTPN